MIAASDTAVVVIVVAAAAGSSLLAEAADSLRAGTAEARRTAGRRMSLEVETGLMGARGGLRRLEGGLWDVGLERWLVR